MWQRLAHKYTRLNDEMLVVRVPQWRAAANLQICAFLTSAKNGDGWSPSRLGHFTLDTSRTGGLWARKAVYTLLRGEKFLLLPEIEPWISSQWIIGIHTGLSLIHNLYSSPNIIKMSWSGTTGEMRNGKLIFGLRTLSSLFFLNQRACPW